MKNTKLFEYFVVCEDILFDGNKLPQGDENLIPILEFCSMLVEATKYGSLSLDQVLAQAAKIGAYPV